MIFNFEKRMNIIFTDPKYKSLRWPSISDVAILSLMFKEKTYALLTN